MNNVERPEICLAGHLGLITPHAPLFLRSAAGPEAETQIAYMAEQGFSGIFDIYLKMRSENEKRAIAGALRANQMSFGTFNNDPNHWNAPLWNQRTESSTEILDENIQSSLEIAHIIPNAKAVCVTARCDPLGYVEQMDSFILNLRKYAERISGTGLHLLVEAVAPQWIDGLFVASSAQAAEIVKEVNHPCVRLLFDIGHSALMGENVVRQLDQYWDLIDTIQLADHPGRLPVGRGELAWLEIFQLIIANQFSGLLECEFQPEPTHDAEADVISQLRHYLHQF